MGKEVTVVNSMTLLMLVFKTLEILPAKLYNQVMARDRGREHSHFFMHTGFC